MSQFDELLAAINDEANEQSELAKSIPAPGTTDDNVATAAAGDGADKTNATTDPLKKEGEEDLTKSLNPEDDQVEVVEVDDLIKSLTDMDLRLEQSEGLMAKALGGALDLIKGQGEMIKSLTAEVKRLGSVGTGRKALLVATERAQPGEHLAKSLPQAEAARPQEILAKCLEAQRAGKLTGGDVARAESQLNHGLAVDPQILARLS